MGLNSSYCSFDPNDSITVASEYKLICERRLLGPWTGSCYFIGVTFGALIVGSLSDKFGRKKMIIACIICALIFGVAVYFSPANVFILMGLRMGQGFFVQGMQSVAYTLIVEYTPVRFRNFIACFWPVYFSLGVMYLGGAGWMVPNWRDMQLFLLLPILIPLAGSWFVVESPLWLLSKNKLDSAERCYRKIAKSNRDDEFLATEEVHSQQQIELIGHRSNKSDELNNGQSNQDNPAPRSSNILQLVTNPILRKHLFCMIGIWFTAAISYYGTLFFLPGLPGNRHTNFIMGGVVEMSAYFVEFFFFTKYGRKGPMIGYQMVNGAVCLGIAVIAAYKSAESSLLSKWLINEPEKLIVFLQLNQLTLYPFPIPIQLRFGLTLTTETLSFSI